MKDMHPDILELLVLRATEGLNAEQAEELNGLLSRNGLDDTAEFDLAAAAAANAFGLERAKHIDDVPEALKAKLRKDADRFFAEPQQNVVELRPRSNRSSGWNWGWATAAVLALVLIATNFVGPDIPSSIETQRERLIADAEGTTVIPWAAPADREFAGVEGNVVWNDERQEGYMLLTGMPANDPATSQYQLWLVDPDRDENPVDGGVFDIPADASSVVIPIDAKLAVNNPKVFAITREQPGGVVVSKGPLLVIASSG